MTRHISPHNQATVPVLDKNGAPLAPTRPSRARRWLETGKAVKCRKHGRFAVQLVNRSAAQAVVPEMALGIDPGARKTGMAVTLQTQEGSKAVAALEIHHRGHRITSAMSTRRVLRRNRRGRLRRRPARFDNRTRKPGWLPPSLGSIQANILTNVKHLRNLFPISRVLIETCKFDPRLMWDEGVEGKEYQESERGRMQVREYVLQRDGWGYATVYTDDCAISGANTCSITVNQAKKGRINYNTNEDLDGYTVRLVSGRTYVIRVNGKSSGNGTLVDPSFVLRRVSDNINVASNNDGGQGLNAKLTYTPTSTEDFHIRVSAHTAGERGSYRVKVTEK